MTGEFLVDGAWLRVFSGFGNLFLGFRELDFRELVFRIFPPWFYSRFLKESWLMRVWMIMVQAKCWS